MDRHMAPLTHVSVTVMALDQLPPAYSVKVRA